MKITINNHPGGIIQQTSQPIINVFGDVVQEGNTENTNNNTDSKDYVEITSDEDNDEFSDTRKEKCQEVYNDSDLVEKLKPIFYNDEKVVRQFLKEIKGMKQSDITDLVNRWVEEKLISDYGNSRKGHLWSILNKAGLYTKTKQNWCRRVD